MELKNKLTRSLGAAYGTQGKRVLKTINITEKSENYKAQTKGDRQSNISNSHPFPVGSGVVR